MFWDKDDEKSEAPSVTIESDKAQKSLQRAREATLRNISDRLGKAKKDSNAVVK